MNQMDGVNDGDVSAMEIDPPVTVIGPMNQPELTHPSMIESTSPTIPTSHTTTQTHIQQLTPTPTPTRHSLRAASKAAIDRIHSFHMEESNFDFLDDEQEESMSRSTTKSSNVRSNESGRNRKKRTHTSSADEHSDVKSDSDSIGHAAKSTSISKSRTMSERSNKRIKRTPKQQEDDEEEEVDEGDLDEEDEEEEDDDDQEDENNEVEDYDVVEKKTKMLDESDDGMDESDSDYEAGSKKKKKKKMKPSKKKSITKEEKTKVIEVNEEQTDPTKKTEADPYSPLKLEKNRQLRQLAFLFVLDDVRATGSTSSEAALLGSLLTMTPPIDVVSIHYI